jgi:uncharacterized protein (TIGR03032 family)
MSDRGTNGRGTGPTNAERLDALWARHHAEWRSTSQVASQWQEAAETEPRLLKHAARGAWWETLARTGATLLVTREYEHLVMALRVAQDGRPDLSFMRLPHPSGLVVDRDRAVVHIASTRNPNQVFDLAPVTGLMPRLDVEPEALEGHPLVPVRSRFFPGSLYMHDLALIGGRLHANAVGQNAVVRFEDDGRVERVWWPACIETADGPIFGRNHLQLNSIAAGETVDESFYSASTDRVSARRPGHHNFPVDRRGVVFSGATREVVARGLTRPHSARLLDGRVWVDNSGYGELCRADGDRFEVVTRLPGWTRGLCFVGDVAFIGTSRVIPRFRHYAPGLDVDRSRCGLHAVDTRTGRVLGSLFWPDGNQIFAIDWIDQQVATGFPFGVAQKRAGERERRLFYRYLTTTTNGAATNGAEPPTASRL